MQMNLAGCLRAEQQRPRRASSTPFRRRGSRAASTPGWRHGGSGSRRQHPAGAAASDIAFEFQYALQVRGRHLLCPLVIIESDMFTRWPRQHALWLQ